MSKFLVMMMAAMMSFVVACGGVETPADASADAPPLPVLVDQVETGDISFDIGDYTVVDGHLRGYFWDQTVNNRATMLSGFSTQDRSRVEVIVEPDVGPVLMAFTTFDTEAVGSDDLRAHAQGCAGMVAGMWDYDRVPQQQSFDVGVDESGVVTVDFDLVFYGDEWLNGDFTLVPNEGAEEL